MFSVNLLIYFDKNIFETVWPEFEGSQECNSPYTLVWASYLENSANHPTSIVLSCRL